jgi:hypothetical protein
VFVCEQRFTTCETDIVIITANAVMEEFFMNYLFFNFLIEFLGSLSELVNNISHFFLSVDFLPSN